MCVSALHLSDTPPLRPESKTKIALLFPSILSFPFLGCLLLFAPVFTSDLFLNLSPVQISFAQNSLGSSPFISLLFFLLLPCCLLGTSGLFVPCNLAWMVNDDIPLHWLAWFAHKKYQLTGFLSIYYVLRGPCRAIAISLKNHTHTL